MMLSAMLYIWFAFLSTLPARGATQCLVALDAQAEISIHAPREGSDYATHPAKHQELISIHAPREGSDRD